MAGKVPIAQIFYLPDAGGPSPQAAARRRRRRVVGVLLAAAWVVFAVVAPRLVLHPATGGPASAAPSRSGSPVTVTCESGDRKEAFLLDSDGNLFHRVEAGPGGKRLDWTPLGRKQLLAVAVATGRDGGIWVFGVAGDETVWYLFQQVPGGTWSAWFPLTGTVSTSVALAGNFDDRIELFGLTAAQSIFHRSQTSAGADSRSAWEQLPGELTSLAAATNGDAGRSGGGRQEQWQGAQTPCHF